LNDTVDADVLESFILSYGANGVWSPPEGPRRDDRKKGVSTHPSDRAVELQTTQLTP
jgi:hypothetical protein